MTNKRSVQPPFDFKKAIFDCNNALLDCKAELQKLQHVYKFGSILSHLDHVSASNSLVCDRFIKKMYDPTAPNSGLRDRAFAAYLAYEESHLSKVSSTFDLWEPTSVGLNVRKARALLHKWFADFTINIVEEAIQFTPGESFISTGDTNLLAKLSLKEHWTTTDACLNDTCLLIYNCIALKRAAKDLIGHVSRRERVELHALAKERGFYYNPGFFVFSILLQERVLTIVDGARGSTVPKNVEKDRFINIEATFPMILQRFVAANIKRKLKNVGNFVSPIGGLDAQALHGMLISRECFSTVDFSNASDSVITRIVRHLFPSDFCRYVLKYRSQTVHLGSQSIEPLKLSSMGNGFTFETMTAMLYAVACVFEPSSSRVFGDDVIIHNKSVDKFIEVCSYIGFSTNESKTFIRSNFRESCGKFYHSDFGYLLSYDINPCKSFQDVIINHNKLFSIIEFGSCDYIINSILRRCVDRIRRVALASQSGPVPVSHILREKGLALYFWDRQARRKQMNSKLCRLEFQSVVGKSGSYFADLQLNPSDYCICHVPFYVARLSRTKRTRTAKFSAILYSGQSVKDSIRGKGKWVNLQAIVDSNGNVTLTRNIYKYVKNLSRHSLNIGDVISLNTSRGWEVTIL